jgi:hypothetical protein
MNGTPPAPGLAQAWRHQRPVSRIWLIPLAAAVIAAYLGYATWITCGPPDTIDPLGTLVAETLDAILIGDVTEACPARLEWDLAR